MGKRKKQKEAEQKDQKQEAPKNTWPTRRTFLLAGTGLVVTAGIYTLMSKDNAGKNSSSCQSELERMVQDKRIAWIYGHHVDSVTYAPGLKAHQAYLQNALDQARLGGDMAKCKRVERSIAESKEYARMNERAATSFDREMYAITGIGYEYENATQKKSKIFVTERFFNSPIASTEEDRICILYHEGLHVLDNAGLIRSDRAKWIDWLRQKLGSMMVPQEVEDDRKLSSALHELPIINDELIGISKGTFEVSKRYGGDTKAAYNKFYAVLQQYAKNEDAKGWCAQAILNMVSTPPK